MYVYLIPSMPKTHPFKLPDVSVWIRIRIQIGIFLVGYVCIVLKASYLGSLFGPRLFLWPCILFYLSIFATPVASMLQILILGLIHDSVFDMPLGLSSFTWISWYWFLAKQRRYLVKANIKILWGAFAVTLCAVNSIEYIVLVKTHHGVDCVKMLIETIFLIGFFPIAIHLFHSILLKLGNFR